MTKHTKASAVGSSRRRPPRSRKIKTGDFEPLPGFMREYTPAKLGLTAEDSAWLGDDGTVDPFQMLNEKGYELKSAFRLLLEAIVDANPDKSGRTRAQRIDGAEALLLGTPKRRGVDPIDDDEILRVVARRYYEQWLENPEIEIEVAPIVETRLKELELGPEGHPTDRYRTSAVRRIVRTFKSDRDRLLASVTNDPRWDPPSLYLDLLSIIDTLKRLGVKAIPAKLLDRMNRKEWEQKPPK
jgi:hypothetical protein